MAIDKRLKIYDSQGNEVDYDILATDVKFANDGKDLPTKLAELEEEIGGGGYTPPAGGIPATDLAPAVQTSLGKADTAYQKPASGIPATDLADGVIPDVSGFATKTEVNTGLAGKVDKNGTDSLMTAAEHTKLAGLPTSTELGDTYATKTELADKVDKVTGKGLSTNDYTDAEKIKLAGIAAGAEVNVQSDWNASSGDAAILNKPTLSTVATSGSYNDLSNKPTIPAVPANIVQSVSVNGGTAETPDQNGNVDLNVPAGAQGPKGDTGNVQVDGDGNVLIVNDLDQSVTGAALDATQGKKLKETIVSLATLVNDALKKVAWIDDDGEDITDDIQDIIDGLTAPIIYTDLSSLSFATTTGTPVTKTIKVHGGNLTADITLAVSGTGFSIDKQTISKDAGETIVTVTYNPSATGTNTGNIVISSTGATSVVVSLAGEAVAEPAIVVDTQTLTFTAIEGSTATKTFKVTPINLSNDISLSVSGTGFSIDKQTISKNAGETTVTVTYAPVAVGTDTGSITIASSGVTSKTVSLSGTATVDTIQATFSTTKQIYTCDTLDWLKQFVTVEYNGDTIPSTDFTLSGTLQVGTSTLTVTYDGKTASISISNVLAGVASFTNFVNGVANNQNPPFYQTNAKRSTDYTPKPAAGGKRYTFAVDCNYNTAYFGIVFLNQLAQNNFDNNTASISSNYIYDSTWKQPGDEFDVPATVYNSNVVSARCTSKSDNSGNTNIPADYLVERLVLIEVVSE